MFNFIILQPEVVNEVIDRWLIIWSNTVGNVLTQNHLVGEFTLSLYGLPSYILLASNQTINGQTHYSFTKSRKRNENAAELSRCWCYMPSLLNLWFQRLGKIAPLAFLKWLHPNWANIFFTRKTRKGTLFTLNSSLPLLLLVDSCRNNFGKCCRVRDFGRCVVTHMGLFCI